MNKDQIDALEDSVAFEYEDSWWIKWQGVVIPIIFPEEDEKLRNMETKERH